MKTPSSGKNITEIERTLGALLRAPYQILAIRVYSRLAQKGFDDVRIAHSAVFRNIETQGSRITELADCAQMTKQSMSYLIESLERSGYVALGPDPRDGRAKRVHLTERGIAVQQAALEISREVEQEVAAILGNDDLQQLRELLERLIEGLAQDTM